MIYFSELLHKKVYTEDKIYIGQLSDIIFLATDNPIVTKLVIETPKRREKLIVPISYLQKLNSVINLQKSYQVAELEINELYVLTNLLDKQIIDIKGNKVVRVNDVAIQERPSWYIAGVDIGFFGVLRWFKLESPARDAFNLVGMHPSPRFLAWSDIQPIELARGKVKLKKEDEKLKRMRPEDLADYLEKTNIINTRRVLKLLDEGLAAQVIGNLNINYQTALFRHFHPEKAAEIVRLIDPDEAVDILLTLSPKRRSDILAYLTPLKRREINYLFNLSHTSIGESINSEFLTVRPTDTVNMVFNKIKHDTTDFRWLNYIYVVNAENQLSGVFNLRELLMQSALDTPVFKFMNQNVIVIHLTTPREIAIKKLLKYRVEALPVIDQSKHILGIVILNDLAEAVLQKI